MFMKKLKNIKANTIQMFLERQDGQTTSDQRYWLVLIMVFAAAGIIYYLTRVAAAPAYIPTQNELTPETENVNQDLMTNPATSSPAVMPSSGITTNPGTIYNGSSSESNSSTSTTTNSSPTVSMIDPVARK
jgi:hypothetical protein